MTPLLLAVWGLKEDAKESARVAAEVEVAADETKAAAEPRLALPGGPGGRRAVASATVFSFPGVGGLHTDKPLREVMQTWPETR
jgi:hypothetical protein